MTRSPAAAARVSVLIPAYNAARFLFAALESVSAQTWRDFEIVVVDDGSTDETPAILRAYAAREPRLTIVTQRNGGISAALNAGLAHCRGDYVSRMDADDLMMPERIARQVAFLEAHPAIGFCGSSIVMIDADDREVGRYLAPVCTLAELDGLIARREIFSFTHPTVTFRRAALAATGGYAAAFEPCEDLDLFLRLIAAGHPGVALAEPLLRYRLHGNSISGGNALRQIRMRNYLLDRWYRARDGAPPIDFATFVRGRGAAGLWRRWRDRADALHNVAHYRRATGRRATGTMLAALALAMKADRLPRRLFGARRR